MLVIMQFAVLPRCFQAMFEIITSEFSYMHSLSVLVGCFKKSEELKETMTQTEHHHLFSNISDILAVSTRQVGHCDGRPLQLCDGGAASLVLLGSAETSIS